MKPLLKKAKLFATQKTIRRLKRMPDDIKLQEELKALQTLDVDALLLREFAASLRKHVPEVVQRHELVASLPIGDSLFGTNNPKSNEVSVLDTYKDFDAWKCDVDEQFLRLHSSIFDLQMADEEVHEERPQAAIEPRQRTPHKQPAPKSDANLPSKPKNRMGQKARRLLWEQLHGEKANHVRKQSQKAAVEIRSRNIHKKQKPSAQQNEPLHPSWEAKKRQNAAVSHAEFSGKKIKFED